MNNEVKRKMPKVEVIKATKRSVRNPDIVDEGKKLRVAAYCRVSTDDEEQQTSYTKQKQYYTEHINNNPKWELVDIYADEGISGTSTKRRSEFNRMMRDAEAGKIDLILQDCGREKSTVSLSIFRSVVLFRALWRVYTG